MKKLPAYAPILLKTYTSVQAIIVTKTYEAPDDDTARAMGSATPQLPSEWTCNPDTLMIFRNRLGETEDDPPEIILEVSVPRQIDEQLYRYFLERNEKDPPDA